MPLVTDAQTQKIVAALQPLYQDPDFATLTGDFVVNVTQTPAAPAPETDPVDVPKQ